MFFGRRRERAIKRVLIVEDEPLVAFDNEHTLMDAGYTVAATVDNVPAAVRAIRADGIDLVLADVNLSDGGTGIDVALAAREKGVPLLFVTGACPIEAQKLAIGCLDKPYNARDLVSALEAIEATLSHRPVKRMPPRLKLFS